MNFRRIDLEKDMELIISFRKDTEVTSIGTLEGFDAEAYLDRMRERINKFPDGQLFIEENSKPIGQLGFGIQEYDVSEIGYVNLLYLLPEYRGKGIGRELIQHAENFFRQSDVSEYHLRVTATNQGAIRLYTKIGMVKLSEENENWRMRKVL